MVNLKKDAAAKAVSFVANNTVVGLGAGSTIAYVVEFLKHEVKKGLKLKVATSSSSTRLLLLQNNFTVLETDLLTEIDIYFDGCDELDKELNALKSGGGIHTQEKLLASMAKEFVLLGDETKLVDRLDNRFPLVIEVLPLASGFVPVKVQNLFSDLKYSFRISDRKDGYVITDNGNYLLDVWFEEWPDLKTINPLLKSITGVVETSLFNKMANKAIIAGKDGVRILE